MVFRPHNYNNREGLHRERQRHKWFRTYKLEMSISHRIRVEISENRDVWADKTGYRSDIKKTVPAKGGEITEARVCQDHIHILISILPKYSVSQIIGYLKGKSSLMIFDRHANLKYKYGN